MVAGEKCLNDRNEISHKWRDSKFRDRNYGKNTKDLWQKGLSGIIQNHFPIYYPIHLPPD